MKIDKDKLWKAIQNKVSRVDSKQMSLPEGEERAILRGAIKALYFMYDVVCEITEEEPIKEFKIGDSGQKPSLCWERSMYGYDEPCIGISNEKQVLAMKGYAIEIDKLFECLPKGDEL